MFRSNNKRLYTKTIRIQEIWKRFLIGTGGMNIKVIQAVIHRASITKDRYTGEPIYLLQDYDKLNLDWACKKIRDLIDRETVYVPRHRVTVGREQVVAEPQEVKDDTNSFAMFAESSEESSDDESSDDESSDDEGASWADIMDAEDRRS